MTSIHVQKVQDNKWWPVLHLHFQPNNEFISWCWTRALLYWLTSLFRFPFKLLVINCKSPKKRWIFDEGKTILWWGSPFQVETSRLKDAIICIIKVTDCHEAIYTIHLPIGTWFLILSHSFTRDELLVVSETWLSIVSVKMDLLLW